MGSIFISHASKDKDVADQLLSLLCVGIGIHASEVFCTSLGGLGVSVGKDDTETIRQNLLKSSVAFTLVSNRFLESWFCHYELGAFWLTGRPVYVLLIPPVTVSRIKNDNKINAIIGNWQMASSDDATAWDNVRDSLVQELDLKSVPTAVWQARKTEFIRWIKRRNSSSIMPPPASSYGTVPSLPYTAPRI